MNLGLLTSGTRWTIGRTLSMIVRHATEMPPIGPTVTYFESADGFSSRWRQWHRRPTVVIFSVIDLPQTTPIYSVTLSFMHPTRRAPLTIRHPRNALSGETDFLRLSEDFFPIYCAISLKRRSKTRLFEHHFLVWLTAAPPLFRPMSMWPRSPISVTAELLLYILYTFYVLVHSNYCTLMRFDATCKWPVVLCLWSPYGIGRPYIFSCCGLFFFFFFPRLISAAADWMFTILWHMVWP